MRRAAEGWRELFFPKSGPLLLQRIVLLLALVLLASHLPQLLGWPKHPSLWHKVAWDSWIFRDQVGVDFFAIYEAGYFFRNGHDAYLVDGELLGKIGGPLRAPYIATFRYLPINLAWLAAPLSLLPPWRALQFWTLFLGLLTMLGIGATVRLATLYHFGWKGRMAALALWSFSMPLMVELAMGQFTFFVGILLMSSIYHLAEPKSESDEPDAAPMKKVPPRILPWTLALWLKNFPVIWYPWWLGNYAGKRKNPAQREAARRALFAATLSGAILALSTVSYFIWAPNNPLPREDYEHFIEAHSLQWPLKRFSSKATSGRLLSANQTDLYFGRQGVGLSLALTAALPELVKLPQPITKLRAEIFSVPPRGVSEIASTLIKYFNISITAAFILIIFYSGYLGRGSLEAFSLGWLWWFYVYLDCWEHHYSMLIPLLALLAFSRRLPVLLAWIVALLWALPSLWYVVAYYGEAIWEISPAVHGLIIWGYFAQRPLGVLLVTGCLLWRILKLWRSPTPQSARPIAHQ